MVSLELNILFLYHIYDILSHYDWAQSFLNLNERIYTQIASVKAAVSTAKCYINIILWNLFWLHCNSLLWLFWILIPKPNSLAILLGLVSISNLIGKSVRLFGEKQRKRQPEKLNWAQQLINTKFPPGCHDLFIKRSLAITTQFMYSIPILLTKCSVNICTESPMLLTKCYVCCIL